MRPQGPKPPAAKPGGVIGRFQEKWTRFSLRKRDEPENLEHFHESINFGKAQDSKKPSSPAQRALCEAEQRRRALKSTDKSQANEVGGRQGPEPTRYGDWERKGIISDF